MSEEAYEQCVLRQYQAGVIGVNGVLWFLKRKYDLTWEGAIERLKTLDPSYDGDWRR